ncbi:GTPase-activating protein SST2 KNAG_0D05260 [Huiozyma naganishii CBS 8797]|uniref:Protein SST2 n=1 Tax=Huiozyma naganishii (strain ATCC MYA-139 / BCRC 22969 / CBS 8797 / KCTC 17520 / NBRC 10181 / NCYC 3082 / Yp74L-3) TaxID=1071383 RepID=J7S691_HUIN7|nr:hypothetical protein KNAG_0D05260 [Kazachstania naganishii CBS 8797]CCK70264.1 hypothetical protein KNAG_0D05260 [Kazachstania naganishii CBS 8797]
MSNTRIQSQTMHEISSDSLRRTPNGLLFTEDLKCVYSVFLICMNLKQDTFPQKPSFFAIHKPHPFSFLVSDALAKMQKLEISASKNTICLDVSYHIKEGLGRRLIAAFMDAKLLHSPTDRTRSEPKEKVLLQPTPKGVAILTRYAKDIGLKKIPDIMLSSLNSMELFAFERSSITDSLIHSDKLLHILLVKLLGKAPNFWTPINENDRLPPLSKLLECNTDIFTFENNNSYLYKEKDVSGTPDSLETSWLDQISSKDLSDEERISPLSHKYFTNPDSDSHIQYYASDTGIRLFRSKQFIEPKLVAEYTFTSKVLWQWLLDCTDILYPKEAIALAALFLKAGLIIPIFAKPSCNKKGKFVVSRSAFFILSKLGWDLVQWNNDARPKQLLSDGLGNDRQSNSSKETSLEDYSLESVESEKLGESSGGHNSNKSTNPECLKKFLKLDEILADPGLRYLFRNHLEKEFCAENLDVYIEIKKFLKRMTVLKKCLDSKSIKNVPSKRPSNSIAVTMDAALGKQADECLEMASHIYSTYIMVGAPYQLNIEHGFRESITEIILHPRSPLKESLTELSQIKHDSNMHLLVSIDTLPSPPKRAYIPSKSNDGNLSRVKKPNSLILQDTRPPFDSITIGKTYPKLEVSNMNNDSGVLSTLKNLYSLYESVANQMYRLMQTNSLQKFNNSLQSENSSLFTVLP